MNNAILFSSNLLLICSMSLLYLMWRTNSLRSNLPTTIIIVTVGVLSVLHIFELYMLSLVIIFVVMCVLVWRVIPHDDHDTWKTEL